MPYHIRPMRWEDIIPVTEIDREVFPTLWSSINYQNELKNRLAHYFVACDEEIIIPPAEPEAKPKKGLPGTISRVRHILRRLYGQPLPQFGGYYIVGFTGIWLMADEAHVINLAVREPYRRRGIGELLLITAIDLSLELKASIVTLEVRASNTGAQALYRKYGMTEVGLRRGYYVDDKEDAILMSTEDINSAPFQSCFQQLKQAHCQRLGIVPPGGDR